LKSQRQIERIFLTEIKTQIRLFYKNQNFFSIKNNKKIVHQNLGVSISRVRAENRKTDKNRGLLIWTQFQPSTSSDCSGSGHTGVRYSGSILTGYIETLLLHLKFH
jgi:hypothetical protein